MTFSLRRDKWYEFKKNFKEGAYGDKTLGTAFYERFGLSRSCHQSVFKSLKRLDKREAAEEILRLFHLIED